MATSGSTTLPPDPASTSTDTTTVTTSPESTSTGITSSSSSGSLATEDGSSSTGVPDWEPSRDAVFVRAGAANLGDRAEMLTIRGDSVFVVGAINAGAGTQQDAWLGRLSIAAFETKSALTSELRYPLAGAAELGKGIALAQGQRAFMVGRTTTSANDEDFLLVDIDLDEPSGQQTAALPALPGDAAFTSVVIVGEGVFAAGRAPGNPGETDFALYAFAFDGTELWNTVIESEGNASAIGIASSGSRLTVVGYTTVATGDEDATIRRFELDGDLIDEDVYFGEPGTDQRATAVTHDGTGFYVGGYGEVDGEGLNAWVRRYADSGAMQWTAEGVGEGPGDDAIHDIALGSDSELYVCGRSPANDGEAKGWIARLSADGDITGRYTDTELGDGQSRFFSCEVDDAGSLFVGGYASNGKDIDAVVVKYTP